MRRNQRGTTRTGAIPACMAEMTPQQSREVRLNWLMQRMLEDSIEYTERLLFAPPPPRRRAKWLGVYAILARKGLWP